MSPRLRQQPGMPRRLQPAISGLLAVALLSALPAAGGEARSLLKLPTPAGHYAADAAGEPPLRLDLPTAADSDTSPVVDDSLPADEPRIASRSAWTWRGGLAPDDFVTRQEETGYPADTWSLDRWRFDASVIRTF